MGNEFGHPEWIDFPREGNHWSYKYARRQWNLADDHNLKYHYLGDFDKAMIQLIRSVPNFQALPLVKIWDKDDDNILAYMRKDLLFVYNFNPQKSYSDYGIPVPAGEYEIVLDTGNPHFGGFGLNDDTIHHFTMYDPLYAKENKGWLRLYLPARTAMVMRCLSD
jgi:1,4-alpha-glucan branching enzyme